jgi:hypothetical protein
MLYLVSGLHLQTNEPLVGLLSEVTASPADVQIWVGERPPELNRPFTEKESWYVSSDLDDQGSPLLTIFSPAEGAYFLMAWSDGGEFLVDQRGTQIWVKWSNQGTEDDRTSYLLGPVLNFVLSLRGVTSLHASAVSIGNHSVAFVGPTGSGKSTLAAEFGRRGYPVVADDVVALRSSNGSFLAEPGYPRLRLRTLEAKALQTAPNELPGKIQIADEEYFDLDLIQRGYSFEQRALPLAGIYFLSEPISDVPGPKVAAMSGDESLMTLIANSWATRVLNPSMRAREFETLSQVTATVPLRGLHAGAKPSAPEALFEVILKDFHEMNSEPAIPAMASEN